MCRHIKAACNCPTNTYLQSTHRVVGFIPKSRFGLKTLSPSGERNFRIGTEIEGRVHVQAHRQPVIALPQLILYISKMLGVYFLTYRVIGCKPLINRG